MLPRSQIYTNLWMPLPILLLKQVLQVSSMLIRHITRMRILPMPIKLPIMLSHIFSGLRISLRLRESNIQQEYKKPNKQYKSNNIIGWIMSSDIMLIIKFFFDLFYLLHFLLVLFSFLFTLFFNCFGWL